MAKDKKSFILYCDQRGVFDKLSDEEAGKLIKHIFAYVSDESPKGDFVTELAFELIKQQLKRDLKTWEQRQEQRRQAGLRSAEIRKRNAATAERDSTTVNDRSVSSTVNGNVNDTVNGNVNANEIKETDFDIFWKAYDYNQGLRQVQQEWTEITRDMPSEIPKILEHVPKYVKAKPDKNYRKKPANYLKERVWMDEIVDPNKPKEEDSDRYFWKKNWHGNMVKIDRHAL